MKKNLIIKIVVGILIFLSCLSLFLYTYMSKINKKDKEAEKEIIIEEKDIIEEQIPEKPKLKIIDIESKTRPISIMVDNEIDALPQAGLQDAFIIYEFLIEWGQTRFLAIFKDKNTSMIGPIRSTRHYFLDYGLENDVIFAHFGYSPVALEDIKKFNINNISGTQADGGSFWREKPLGGWHNVFTSINKLKERAIIKGYRMTTEEANLFNYSVDDLYFENDQNVMSATNVKVVYSSSHNVRYVYDENSKNYKRFSREKPHLDRVTNEQYTFKNIIVYNVKTYNLNDGSGKGRIGFENIGSGNGRYISNGKAIPITWEKTSRQSKTIYKDLSGNTIVLNDGNTIIHLQPIDKELIVE